jgi:hypothetical protein
MSGGNLLQLPNKLLQVLAGNFPTKLKCTNRVMLPMAVSLSGTWRAPLTLAFGKERFHRLFYSSSTPG